MKRLKQQATASQGNPAMCPDQGWLLTAFPQMERELLPEGCLFTDSRWELNHSTDR